jgi:hypothetical protein
LPLCVIDSLCVIANIIKPDIAYRGELGTPFDYVEMLCIQRS